MSQNLQYPSNPDTSFESFLIAKQNVQIARFGRTISQSECVPLNYTKIYLAGLTSVLLLPVRELQFMSEVLSYLEINDEDFAEDQAANTQAVVSLAFQLWENKYSLSTGMSGYSAAMGIVTEISSSVVKEAYDQPLDPPSFGLYRLVTKIKINWLTPIDSPYS
jgi:hypothetical protein